MARLTALYFSTPSEERDARVCVLEGWAVAAPLEKLNVPYDRLGSAEGGRRRVRARAVQNDPDATGGGGEEESRSV